MEKRQSSIEQKNKGPKIAKGPVVLAKTNFPWEVNDERSERSSYRDTGRTTMTISDWTHIHLTTNDPKDKVKVEHV